MEIAADRLDFQLANGNQLKSGDTVGKAWITILPRAPGSKPAPSNAKNSKDMGGSNSTTVATAGKFHATFDDDNHIQMLHGAPDSRIVSSTPGIPTKSAPPTSLT